MTAIIIAPIHPHKSALRFREFAAPNIIIACPKTRHGDLRQPYSSSLGSLVDCLNSTMEVSDDNSSPFLILITS
ncbi:hypothetical protein N7451_011787 [Penicillium sp. IBT 35674x]|nr:hypothetical protein N7451_011787 [Penicillium sp. IBT 35674x]